MAKAKKKAQKAQAAAMKARANPYVQRLIEDEELRDNLRSAFVSAKNAYGRINGKGPAKAFERLVGELVPERDHVPWR